MVNFGKENRGRLVSVRRTSRMFFVRFGVRHATWPLFFTYYTVQSPFALALYKTKIIIIIITKYLNKTQVRVCPSLQVSVPVGHLLQDFTTGAGVRKAQGQSARHGPPHPADGTTTTRGTAGGIAAAAAARGGTDLDGPTPASFPAQCV